MRKIFNFASFFIRRIVMPIKITRKHFFIGLVDCINLVFLLALFGFLVVTDDYNPSAFKLYALYTFIFIFIISFSFIKGNYPNEKYNLIYLLSAVALFLIMYESISQLLPVYVGDLRYDKWIDDLDLSIFGISPSIWMENITFPILTEILYILYFIYFALPIILIIIFYRNRQFKEVEISIYTLFINYYGAYITYFFMPVEGPRYYLANAHSESLKGIWLAEPIRDFINKCEPSTLDCFPSLHASILVVITMLAAKYCRKLYLPYVILSTIIIFSLVYLRYHYLLDIVIGIIWAIISVYIATYTYQKYSSRFKSLLIDTHHE